MAETKPPKPEPTEKERRLLRMLATSKLIEAADLAALYASSGFGQVEARQMGVWLAGLAKKGWVEKSVQQRICAYGKVNCYAVSERGALILKTEIEHG